jgi:hypothetical protein
MANWFWSNGKTYVYYIPTSYLPFIILQPTYLPTYQPTHPPTYLPTYIIIYPPTYNLFTY